MSDKDPYAIPPWGNFEDDDDEGYDDDEEDLDEEEIPN